MEFHTAFLENYDPSWRKYLLKSFITCAVKMTKVKKPFEGLERIEVELKVAQSHIEELAADSTSPHAVACCHSTCHTNHEGKDPRAAEAAHVTPTCPAPQTNFQHRNIFPLLAVTLFKNI